MDKRKISCNEKGWGGMSKQSLITIIMDQIQRENSITKEQEEKLLQKFEAHTEEELYKIAHVLSRYGTKGTNCEILK
jgi:hypothetical protein